MNIARTTAYTQADALLDLGIVAEKVVSPESYRKLLNALKNKGSGDYGFRFELEVAAHFARLGKPVEVSTAIATAAGKTDIDLIVDGVYYQCKRSAAAMGRGTEGANALRAWVTKAGLHGATAKPVVYVGPSG